MFTKSTCLSACLGFALVTSAICSGTAPAAAYLSLTPRIEVQVTVDTDETIAIHEIGEFVGGDIGAEQTSAKNGEVEKSSEVEKSTDVTELNDNSAPGPVVADPVVAAATSRSL